MPRINHVPMTVPPTAQHFDFIMYGSGGIKILTLEKDKPLWVDWLAVEAMAKQEVSQVSELARVFVAIRNSFKG